MMKWLTLIVLSSLPAAQAADESALDVTFSVRAPGLAPETAVYISGDIPQLGGWDPGKITMSYAGDHTWRKTISMEKARSVEYKYTLGSWEREGADADGMSLANFVAVVTGDMEIEDTVVAWTSGERKFEIRGQVTGRVEYHRGMRGDGIEARDIIAWLPPGYEKDKARRYGVVYMHDGQNIIDPATSSFGIDWQVDETADELIREGAIPPVIVVGMNSTSDRTAEYSPGDKGQAYMDFVVRTVKPFIDSNYRTKPGREHTLTGGSSMGGLIAFMLAWEHPDVFSSAICMSPAFRIGAFDYVSTVLAAEAPRKDLFFYIDNGGIGLEEDLQPGIDAMVDALRAQGYTEGGDFHYEVNPGDRHFESAWAERFPEALELSLRANQRARAAGQAPKGR